MSGFVQRGILSLFMRQCCIIDLDRISLRPAQGGFPDWRHLPLKPGAVLPGFSPLMRAAILVSLLRLRNGCRHLSIRQFTISTFIAEHLSGNAAPPGLSRGICSRLVRPAATQVVTTFNCFRRDQACKIKVNDPLREILESLKEVATQQQGLWERRNRYAIDSPRKTPNLNRDQDPPGSGFATHSSYSNL